MYNIKMSLKETGLDGMDQARLAQDSNRWRDVVYTVMNLGVSCLAECAVWLLKKGLLQGSSHFTGRCCSYCGWFGLTASDR